MCANPCWRFMFILAMLICPMFKLEPKLVFIMLAGGFISGSKLRFELLFGVCDGWIIGTWDSFFNADKAWSKLVCVVGTDAIQKTKKIILHTYLQRGILAIIRVKNWSPS